jgi:hypothetical protein
VVSKGRLDIVAEFLDADAIAEQIFKLLAESPQQEMFLAALGNRVSKALRISLRDGIGDKKFADFIRDNLGSRVALSGSKDRLLATLVASDQPQPRLPLPDHVTSVTRVSESNVARKYAKNFWDAFLRPARRHQRRAIDTRPPFAWSDFQPEAVPEGWKEIESSLLMSYPGQDWLARKRAAGIAIEKWCEQQNLNPEIFTEDHAPSVSIADDVNVAGAAKLLAVINEVPVGLRAAQTLNLEFIHSLLARR